MWSGPWHRQLAVPSNNYGWWESFYTALKMEPEALENLYPHQRNVLLEVLKQVMSGHKAISVVIPPGAGKSYVMAMLPFFLRIGATATICKWKQINLSNSSFFHDGRFKELAFNEEQTLPYEASLLGRLNMDKHKTVIDEPCHEYFGSNTFVRLGAATQQKYSLIQIDEIQDIPAKTFKTLLNNRPPGQIIITYTAFPPPALSGHCQFHHIECPVRGAQEHIKRQCIWYVDTGHPDILQAIGYDSHDQLKADMMADVYPQAKANILAKVYRTEAAFIMLLTAALRRSQEMTVNGRQPGILFKGSRIDMCEYWFQVITQKFVGLRVGIITSKTPPSNLASTLKDYSENRIHILLICNTLSAGWHEKRTAIIVPLGAMAFGSLLQLFGRGNSLSPDYQTNNLILLDIAELALKFGTRFNDYVSRGVRSINVEGIDTVFEQVEEQNDV
ncbi:hypothetical protein H9P43_000237 [Blastocladiella emersonii ATCC 22665]|nr:hypothetical protein H9P43_000237 [Blastocladiella emersonii ATCC 22665]